MKKTISDLIKIAESHGGKCLSHTYTNSKVKYKFECREGHRWEVQGAQVFGRYNREGSWCPTCVTNRKKDSIEVFQEIAKQHGGKCITEKYKDSNTKLLWQCKVGHQWMALPGSIKNAKTWCPRCQGGQKKELNYFKNIALERGGKCLSSKYINIHKKLKWECSLGHRWESQASEISKGKWCSECSSGFGERICRLYLEQIFNEKFPKSYPHWLSKKIGDPRELDGYCERLGIAFEHHGRQHYEFLKAWHGVQEKFILQKKKDSLRRRRCKENDVILIEIPEINWKNGVSLAYFPIFLENNLKKFKIVESSFKISDIRIDLSSAYSPDFLEEFNNIAASRDGKCLSDNYLGLKHKLVWRCDKEHEWKAIPSTIRNGSWCPVCKGRNATIEDMHKIAREKKGECLSKVYVNSQTKLKWKCSQGHEWKAASASIKFGRWCPSCAKNSIGDRTRLTIREMQELALAQNGVCISSKYINAKTKLKWRCSEGHTWEAEPASIKKGSWCKICANRNAGLRRRCSIEQMRDIAKKKNGLCLSDEYISTHEKLLWKCSEGHKWEATPSYIKSGWWCPTCKKKF